MLVPVIPNASESNIMPLPGCSVPLLTSTELASASVGRPGLPVSNRGALVSYVLIAAEDTG